MQNSSSSSSSGSNKIVRKPTKYIYNGDSNDLQRFLGDYGIPGYRISDYTSQCTTNSYEKYNIQVISDKIKYYAVKIAGYVDEIYNYNCDNYTIEVKDDKLKIGEYIEKNKKLNSRFGVYVERLKQNMDNVKKIKSLIVKINSHFYSMALCNKFSHKSLAPDIAETVNKSINDGIEKVIKEMEVELNMYIENDNSEEILNKIISIHTECTDLYSNMQLLFDKYETQISELSKCAS